MKYRFCIAVSLFFVFCSVLAYAGPIPDTGQILQQQQQKTSQSVQKLPPQEKQDKKETAVFDGPTVKVKQIEFKDFESVAAENELKQITDKAIGKELSFKQLQKLADEITSYLREKGFFLARAYLPEQDVSDGIITIAVIAGIVEDAPVVRMAKPFRIEKSIIDDLARQGVSPSEPLDENKLERSLLLINDIPGVSAKSTIEKGSKPGTTKVFIDAAEGAVFDAALSVDNFGNRYTGIFQTTAQAALNNPSGKGDQAWIAHTQASGLFKDRFSYSAPIGDSGLKGSAVYTFLWYELQKDLESLDADGSAHALNLGLQYPYVRSRKLSVWYDLKYDYRHLTDRIADTKTRLRDLHVVRTGINMNGFDDLNGGGLTNLSLEGAIGLLDLGVNDDAIADKATAKTEGGFLKYNYSVSRLQRLCDNWSIFDSLSGQFANQNLDTSEKIILGGPSGVRAYPVGEASGDEGHIFTKEIRYDHPKKILSHDVQVIGFYDAGYMILHNDGWANSVTTATGRNKYWISGFGAGLSISKADKYTLHLTYTDKIGNNPGRTTAEKDADNKDKENRIWAQFIMRF